MKLLRQQIAHVGGAGADPPTLDEHEQPVDEPIWLNSEDDRTRRLRDATDD